jgi:Ca2+-binding RTX toxin-like protein
VDSTISSNGREGIGRADILHVSGSTIVGNGDTGIIVGPREGDFTIRNSIVSGNAGEDGREIELFDFSGALWAPGEHNVFGRQGDAGLYGMVPSDTDIVASGPLGSILDPELAANGGPTLTHLLRSESPARDGGSACSSSDQRGAARPQGPACDIGAVELVLDPCASANATFGCTVNGVPNQRCLGTTGNDTIVGSSGADVIVARAGDDVVWAAAGDDIVCGGNGNDTLQGGSGNDLVSAGPGNDSLSGDYGADILFGGPDANICASEASDVSIASCY